MNKPVRCLLVGQHFRPPAKLILDNLVGGTQLRLEPEPDNPYDGAAVKVMLDDLTELRPVACFDDLLLGAGWTRPDLDDSLPLQLGYIARAENKQFVKLQAGLDLTPNTDLTPAQTCSAARLAFGPSGETIVEIST